jgi:hypothetical protein
MRYAWGFLEGGLLIDLFVNSRKIKIKSSA